MARFHLKLWEMLGQNLSQIVPHDVGVADDGGVVDHLAHAMDNKNDVSDVGQSVSVRAELFVSAEKPFT